MNSKSCRLKYISVHWELYLCYVDCFNSLLLLWLSIHSSTPVTMSLKVVAVSVLPHPMHPSLMFCLALTRVTLFCQEIFACHPLSGGGVRLLHWGWWGWTSPQTLGERQNHKCWPVKQIEGALGLCQGLFILGAYSWLCHLNYTTSPQCQRRWASIRTALGDIAGCILGRTDEFWRHISRKCHGMWPIAASLIPNSEPVCKR